MNMMAIISFAAESGNQSGMNIHHPALEIIGNLDQLQEAGQANQVGPMLAAKIEKLAAEFFSCGKGFALDHGSGNIKVFRAHQAIGVGIVGGHENDLSLQTTVGD